MSLHLSQFLWFLVFFGSIGLTGWAVWQKRYKIAAIPALLFMVLMFAMPVRMTAPDGVASLEQSVNRFESMPDRVTAEKPDFQTLREEQLTQLKERSQELQNENK